jgi:sulfate/thiosulfate transport system substrate-binding protein
MATRFSRPVRRLFGRADGRHGAPGAAARVGLAASAAVAIAVGVTACGGSSSADSSGGPIDIVAYSTPETVYKDGLIPAFEKTSQGSGATFSTSFGPSGDQSRAVESGQQASVVHFSIEPDMQRLVDAGKVASDWNQNSYNGFVQDSVVVFVVRKGNPDDIQNWDDLVKPGVEVLTPNPFSSGGARWNLMAAYGAQLEEGKSDAEAQEYLKQLLGNVALQAPAASDSMTAFTQGKGDVALAYENEAIAAQKAGEDVDYVIPDDTILIQTPIATTTDASTQAQDFVKWLYTPEAQQVWADNGYRPVNKKVLEENAKEFPTPSGLFTIDKVGGWDEVTTKFFDEANGIVTRDEQDVGVSTSG